MKTHKDNQGIVHFSAPELRVEPGEHSSNSFFYPPHAWLQVLAWGKEATLVGHGEPITHLNSRTEYVVFKSENHVTGIHPSKVSRS